MFTGPLDLLLQLIERAELDVTTVALSQVTDQYLSFLESLKERSPEELSAFIVIAARLIQIKSEAVLPRPPERHADEEDPADLLARQLIEYRRYKQAAVWMGERAASNLRSYLRLAPPPKIEATVKLDGFGLTDLLEAGNYAFSRRAGDEVAAEVIRVPRVTLREKIKLIRERLRASGRATFLSLFGRSRSRVEVVVTFLAILELVKRRQVFARQRDLFGEIELEPSEPEDASPLDRDEIER